MITNIPIFDTLSHPTITRDWMLPKYPQTASIEKMLVDMRTYNIKKTFAVGMKDIGGYEEDTYVDFINTCGQGYFLPIAFFDFKELDLLTIKRRLIEIKQKGYCGIKLHPRFANFILSDERLPYIIDVANELDLIPMLCTFFYCNHQSMLDNNIERLGDLLMKCSCDSDLILLHGGLTRLLETMELVRFFPNALLDLSLTMCKYEGTHIDDDIKYIFAPLFTTIKAVPVASFIILALLWVRGGNLSICISFLMVLPIVYINMLEGFTQVDRNLLEMAAVFRLSRSKKIKYIYVPQLLPYFTAACTTSLGLCWKSGIAAEVIGLPNGSMGNRLYETKLYMDTPEMFAWTVVIVLISFVVEKGFLWLLDKTTAKITDGYL